MSSTSTESINAAALAELAAVKGQLTAIMTMLSQQHDATNQRINDLRGSLETRIDDMRDGMETRMDGLDKRMSTLESNERGTAIRTAGVSALTAAIVSAGVALMRYKG